MKLYEEFKLFEAMWEMPKKPLKTTKKAPLKEPHSIADLKESSSYYKVEERHGKKYFTNRGDCYKFFRDISFHTDLDTFIEAIRKAGCKKIILEIEVDPDEIEPPIFFVQVKDIYKLNSKEIPKITSVTLIGEGTDFSYCNLDCGVNCVELSLGDSYALNDIKAFTNDVIDTLNKTWSSVVCCECNKSFDITVAEDAVGEFTCPHCGAELISD